MGVYSAHRSRISFSQVVENNRIICSIGSLMQNERQFFTAGRIDMEMRCLHNLAGFYHPYNLRFGVDYYEKNDFQYLGNW